MEHQEQNGKVGREVGFSRMPGVCVGVEGGRRGVGLSDAFGRGGLGTEGIVSHCIVGSRGFLVFMFIPMWAWHNYRAKTG